MVYRVIESFSTCLLFERRERNSKNMIKDTIMEIHYDVKKHKKYSLDCDSLTMYSRHQYLTASLYKSWIIGGAVLFATVAVPNIREWVELQGLNNLTVEVRLFLISIGFLIGVIAFLIGRKTPLKNSFFTKDEYLKKYNQSIEVSCQNEMKEVISKASNRKSIALTSIIGSFIIGVFLFIAFFNESNFLTFFFGTVCTTLSGVLAINFKQAAITEQLVKRFIL